MDRTSRETWAKRVERWKDGGLRAKEYAAEVGISEPWTAARRSGPAPVIPTSVRIFVCTEPQDMRRSFDGLSLAVRERLALDPESGALFVFASKRGNQLKVLWFDHNWRVRPVNIE